MKIFIITPYSLDPDFFVKKATMELEAKKVEIEPLYGSLLPDGLTFDLQKTRENLFKADVIVADLSYERPSCYYEVGFADALNKQVILIAKVGTVIHQVMESDGIRLYSNLIEYEKLIVMILSEIVNK